VCEIRAKTSVYKITPKDVERGYITVEHGNTVLKPVPEIMVKEPSLEKRLRFWGLAGACALLGIFFLGIILIWLRCQWKGKSPPRATDIALGAILASAMPIVSAFLSSAIAIEQRQPDESDYSKLVPPPDPVASPSPFDPSSSPKASSGIRPTPGPVPSEPQLAPGGGKALVPEDIDSRRGGTGQK
jgi:hypothetical protein